MPAFTTVRVGATHTVLPLQLRLSGQPTDVTGATLTGRLQRVDVSPIGAAFAATGTFTVTAGKTDGSFTYQPSAGDLSVVGEYVFQVKAVFADTTIGYGDPSFLDVLAVP